MTKSALRHPEQERLLRYLDGELPARDAGEVRTHLEACWQCRVEANELEAVIGECVRYRQDVVQRFLPAPPAPWGDIRRKFSEIDVAQAGRSGAISRIRTWAIAAMVAMVFGAALYRLLHTPPVQAAELLRKAVAAADVRAVKSKRIRIRTRGGAVIRTVGTPSRSTSSLQAMFAAARFNWNDPLSARSYEEWRAGLPEKRDQVVSGPRSYTIQTSTNSGELLEATLTLSAQGLQPLEERLEFRNQEWVEITPAPETEPEPGEPVTHTMPPVLTAPAHEAGATAVEELQVLAALHGIGADLGDPIEVSREGGAILVSGLGLTPSRQREIQALLALSPHVKLRFPTTAPAGSQPDKPAPDAVLTPGIAELQARIAEQTGGRARFEELAAQTLDQVEPLMAHAYALRRLAARFPKETEAELDPAAREILAGLRKEHANALRKQAAGLDRTLKPVLTPLAGEVPSGAPATPGTWQAAAEETLQSARQVDKLSAVVFGAAPSNVSGQQLPAQLLASLNRLRASLETGRRDE